MPRFVILQHDTPPGYERPPHLDLMLEAGGALKTFALPRWPSAGETVACEQLADHRAAYLEYEGEVSGNRGSVTRYDAGEYEAERATSETLVLRMRGERHTGRLILRRSAESNWEASWHAAISDA